MLEANIEKFIEWLSYKPSGNEICRAIVTEYSNGVAPYSARLSRLNNDDSLTVIGEYGYESHEAEVGKNLPSQEWRNRPPVVEVLTRGTKFPNWTDDELKAIFSMRDRGSVQGYLTLRFLRAPDASAKEKIEENLASILLPLSLYLSLLNQIENQGMPKVGLFVENNISNNSIQLTQRQKQILRGMVEGKTNHDLAIELGFSVSTVRHETMAIYKELSVSDRYEAARIAVKNGLIS